MRKMVVAIIVAIFPFTLISATSADARVCRAGYHLGYKGKYCWPNHHRVCPAGTHLGYKGKYCWKNH